MNIRLKYKLKGSGKVIIILFLVVTGSIFTINSVLSAAQYDQGDNPLNKIQASPQYDISSACRCRAGRGYLGDVGFVSRKSESLISISDRMEFSPWTGG